MKYSLWVQVYLGQKLGYYKHDISIVQFSDPLNIPPNSLLETTFQTFRLELF